MMGNRILGAILMAFSLSSAVLSEEVKLVSLGGYFEADPEDDDVREAATFAVLTQLEGNSPPGTYSFSVGSEDINNVDIEIIEAREQVVAGINYSLLIAMKMSEDCVGAFRVTIYDRFGDISVTDWGDEVDCNEIYPQGEEQVDV
eukprot:CAMPEP_0195524348 /NCGR_PEP_ID=MMETSP0794_2-20130614/24119_1 /TAXON_ID=515487 /ORGANISM="Stephanopyxis turris, Strain CCMP 815" /LENGTH=144 /DNA_ID=CAMNT_0040654551 /DNA_START=57 /DNA_END=491 /DNA_ORIENTATION=+